MRVHLIAVTLLVGALAQGAYAQTSSTANSSSQPNASASQQAQSLPAEIKSKLTEDGFSNVTVVPGSFVVSAKDKHGDPVTMVIGPNSMTMMTAVQPQNQGSTTGSGSSPGMSSRSTNPSSSK